MTTEQFSGAKLALLNRERIVTLLRDDRADIPYPAFWDLPGGGREDGESPEECALRETREELGLALDPAAIGWRREFLTEGRPAWFMVAELPRLDARALELGDEGQRIRVMPIERFLSRRDVVPYLQHRLQVYLSEGRVEAADRRAYPRRQGLRR